MTAFRGERPASQKTTTVESKAGIALLAFDLDGTLVDSAPDLNYCLGRALESLGLNAPTESETRSWIGDGVEELVRRALASSGRGDALLRTALDAFSECYARNLYVRSRLYPEAAATLDALRERGLRLCCVTNKRLRFAEALLAEAGLIDRFELVLGGDSVAEKKPSPMLLHAAAERLAVDGAAALFVGDSEHDMQAAHAAGWRFCWAAYGYRRIEPDGRIAELVIDALADLVTRLDAYLSQS